MTGLVDRMEKNGLVRRVPGRRDRRSIELEATPAGVLALSGTRAASGDRARPAGRFPSAISRSSSPSSGRWRPPRRARRSA
jgi:hypothetical protein